MRTLIVPDEKDSRDHGYRLRLFLLSAIAILGVMYVLSSALNTLRTLDMVEAERDSWQRPADVLRALALKDGNTVVDLGSGAGYFSLKISRAIGSRGQVLAVDLRKLSLTFLWIRAALRTRHNVHVMVGEEDDPHLPAEAVDAVLIANTYHEFRNPRVILDHVFRSLRPGGRLVIIDRGPLPGEEESREFEAQHHERAPSGVETEIRETGFNLISRRDRFIDRPPVERPGDRPDNRPWWLIVARKP
jgi:predicted methyltransferase